MTKYEFPTEPDKNEPSLFAGAFPAHGNGGSNFINWQGCDALSILEAAALSYGMHPYFVIEYVHSENCGTLQRGFLVPLLPN